MGRKINKFLVVDSALSEESSSRSLPQIKFRQSSSSFHKKTKHIHKTSKRSSQRYLTPLTHQQSSSHSITSTIDNHNNSSPNLTHTVIPNSIKNIFLKHQTNTQKYKRLQKYFKEDINSLYPELINEKDVEIFAELQCKTIKFGESILKELYDFDIHHLCEYLQIVNRISKRNRDYCIIEDGSTRKYYICYYQGNIFEGIQISKIHVWSLKHRQNLLIKIDNLITQYNLSNGKQKMPTQLTKQLLVLHHISSQLSIELKSNFSSLKQKVIYESQTKSAAPEINPIKEYQKMLIYKFVNYALTYEPDDIYSYFSSQEAKQLSLNEDVKIEPKPMHKSEFKKYLSNKNKKNQNLPTVCLGCFGSSIEQSCRFLKCSQCSSRFHELCFQGDQFIEGSIYEDQYQDKVQYICQNCIRKSQQPQNLPQCEYCGQTGLLSMKNSVRMHVFCALLNNLWDISNNRMVINDELISCRDRETPMNCQICNKKSILIHFCLNCLKMVHASCAYLAGYKMMMKDRHTLSIWCCGKQTNKEQTKLIRKCISNHEGFLFKNKGFLI